MLCVLSGDINAEVHGIGTGEAEQVDKTNRGEVTAMCYVEFPLHGSIV